ncbi:MAG: hypothetical protein WD003_01200 [Candidatus Paceibacterota bacterium]
MLKDYFMKKMLERQLKDLPESQREMVKGALEKNPELFKKIAEEVKRETKKGIPEAAATMQVMRKHQGELQKLLR